MGISVDIRPIAAISSSATRDLELAGIRMKVQNRMKSLKKYTNTGFIATACRFALYGPLEGIICLPMMELLLKQLELKL
jgi:hypothetical protein